MTSHQPKRAASSNGDDETREANNGTIHSNHASSPATTSSNNDNIFLPKQHNNRGDDILTSLKSEEEFSEVFDGQMKTVYEYDLTKRVLDNSLRALFQQKQDREGMLDSNNGDKFTSSREEGGGIIDKIHEDHVFDDEVNFDEVDDDCFDHDNVMDHDLGEYHEPKKDDTGILLYSNTVDMPNVDSFQSCNSREVDTAVTLLGSPVTEDSFKSCNSTEMETTAAAELITKSALLPSSGSLVKTLARWNEQTNNVADAELELSNRSTDGSIITGPMNEQLNLDDEELDETFRDSSAVFGAIDNGSTVDPKLRRRQKIASMKASGRLNVPSKSRVSASDMDNNANNTVVDQSVDDETPTFIDKSTVTQQIESEPTHATTEDDQVIDYLVNSIEASSSNNTAYVRPKAAPVDPKLKRRHKMASRVASGKVNVPKSFLSAAATSANAVAELEDSVKINVKDVTSGERKIDNKSTITAMTLEQSIELQASLNAVLDINLDSGFVTQKEIFSSSESATPSHESSHGGGQMESTDAAYDPNKTLDKNEARRQRRQLRKKDASIIKTSEDEKSSIDACFESANDAEAKQLFPMPSLDDTTIVISVEDQRQISTALDCLESAWDERATLNLDTLLEHSKIENGQHGDVKPLLELEAVSSDAAADDNAQIAAAKLMSQKERMLTYNSIMGFGIGEDSSVELLQNGSENDEADEMSFKSCDYEAVGAEGDDVDDDCSQPESDIFDFTDFGRASHEEFSAAGSSAMVQSVDRFLVKKSDEISTGRLNVYDDTNSSTTGGGTVLGLRFLESNDEKSTKSRPTSPMSPAATDVSLSQLRAVDEDAILDEPKLFKIAPIPAEKLKRYEESKRGLPLLKPSATMFVSIDENSIAIPSQNSSSMTPKNTPPSIGDEKTSPSLKISTPKSPSKRSPHSINDELMSGTKMAERFAMASIKAAKKFEEEYSHIEHDIQYASQSNSPARKGSNNGRFFCAGDAVIFPTGSTDETENNRQLYSPSTGAAGPGFVELVGGAFSPWKIPDRADEDSNASSSRILYDDESYHKASIAALNAIRGKSEMGSSVPQPGYDPQSDETSDIGLNLVKGDVSNNGEDEGVLSGVLVWLFDEVLPSNAFSAFDIHTSTSVQARRLLAIANDDRSFNLICQYVRDVVIKQYGHEIDCDRREKSEIQHTSSSGDLSTSTVESSQVSSIPSSSIAANRSSFSERAAARILKDRKRSIEPFSVPINADESLRPPGEMLAANFFSFLQQISHLSGETLPFNDNPYLQSVVNLTTKKRERSKERKSMQELVFQSEEDIVRIFLFLKACCRCDCRGKTLISIIEPADNENENMDTMTHHSPAEWNESDEAALQARLTSGSETLRRSNKRKQVPMKSSKYNKSSDQHQKTNLNLIVPKMNPSPFETSVWNDPSIVLSILSFLGNPVSVCVVKRLNVFCNRLVNENEHVLMRDAVRLGGMSKFVRPSFWLWVTMERCTAEQPIPLPPPRRVHEQSFSFNSEDKNSERNFSSLKTIGANGKWQHIIERDVLRAFGNMPPHKTGAKYRQDSIVRALVSFGKEEIMRNSRSYQAMDKLPEESEARHFRLSSCLDRTNDGRSDDSSETPTDTVSDWGGITPVGSMVSEATSEEGPKMTEENAEKISEVKPKSSQLNVSHSSKSDVCDPVLSGNALTYEMKADLQNKLRSVLHALAAQHEGLGYCQGMDYIVAHLLRVLQDTILIRVIQGSMPMLEGARSSRNLVAGKGKTTTAEQLRTKMNEINSETMVVDEAVFCVMDTLFTTYNLQHMYWPELRCLKTCCRVFESLIKQKLPVLADHFEHHDLNVGLFALGWFQTLFLYLPSMPSATVCHMWDIWLVERSFKIFFRVGTAILFLSQPTLLNHDLEGMMTYLNTFPDATLLRRDILLPCALQIKITNSMLVEIEMDVTNFGKANEEEQEYSVF